jgi:hypothetical protein
MAGLTIRQSGEGMLGWWMLLPYADPDSGGSNLYNSALSGRQVYISPL